MDVNFTVAPDFIYEANDYFIGNYSYEICWGNASGIFGDYNCDASENLVISAIDFIKTHSENVLNPEDVSFVLWTGYVSVLPIMLIFQWASEIALFKKKKISINFFSVRLVNFGYSKYFLKRQIWQHCIRRTLLLFFIPKT